MVRLPNTWFSNTVEMNFNNTSPNPQFHELITVQANVISFGHVIASVWAQAEGASSSGAVAAPVWWGVFHGGFNQANPLTPDIDPERWLCWSLIDVSSRTFAVPADSNIIRELNTTPQNDKQESRGMRRLTPQRDNCTFTAGIEPPATPATNWNIKVRAAVRILCFQSSDTQNARVSSSPFRKDA